MPKTELYMRLKKLYPSAQGMAICGNLLFQLYHTGKCAVYDLKSKSPEALAAFPLGSSNDGVPDSNYTNHSNQCMFSDIHIGDNPLPLLYVTCGCGTEGDDNGFYYRCAVENIELELSSSGTVTGGRSSLVQTVSYKNDGIGDTSFETPCWGCPAWFVDSKNCCLYMFSSRYRTTAAFAQYKDRNKYIITRFSLPDPTAGENFVILTAKDILDQFTAPFDIFFTQGGMISGNKLYYTFGCGSGYDGIYPDGMRIYDLERKQPCSSYDFSGSCFAHEEIESCSFYNGKLLINTNASPEIGIFSISE